MLFVVYRACAAGTLSRPHPTPNGACVPAAPTPARPCRAGRSAPSQGKDSIMPHYDRARKSRRTL